MLKLYRIKPGIRGMSALIKTKIKSLEEPV